MFLKLLERALKTALHEATEEWALEVGLPRAAVEQARARRLALAAAEEAQADERAARALGVEDDELNADGSALAALPMPAAARVTAATEEGPCPTPSPDESEFMQWVHQQRQGHVGWAEVARLASAAGHAVREDALRMRYHRWREKDGQAGSDAGSPLSATSG